MKRIPLILTILMSVSLLSTKLYAQGTDNTVTLGNVAVDDQLRIQVYPQGRFNVARYSGGTWVRQFYDQSTTPLFAIKIGTTTYSSSGTTATPGAVITGVGTIAAFDSIRDVGTAVMVGTMQEMTKRFFGTYGGQTFTVTIKITYNTTVPEYFVKHASIDATNIPAGTFISFAYGFDTYLANNDKGYAYVVPDIFGLNNAPAETDRYLTTAQVQSLRLVGARNNESGNSIIAYFPIGLDFDRAWSSTPYPNGYSYNVLALSPGLGSSSGDDLKYKFQFGPYSSTSAKDNAQGVGYDNIPAGEITEIKTGLTFTTSLDGELNYFWNGVKNYTASVGDAVNLDLHYLSYSSSTLNNVGFRIDFTGLHINTGGCTSSGFTGQTENCTSGNDFYQLSNAIVPATGSADISIPVNVMQAGQWVIGGGSITNTSQVFPLGSPATLTVPTTVHLTDSVASRIDKGETKTYTIKFPDMITAAQNVTINLTYYGDISAFSSLPASVTIPAGSNSVSFQITALPTSASNSSILITLSNTDKVFASITEPSSNRLTIEYEPIEVNVCQGDSVTFVATPTNGGITPTYQWKKNNINISGATNAKYSYIPTDGDSIVCEMTTTAICPFPTTVFSPTMVVVTNFNPMISIIDRDSICVGITTQLTSTMSGTWVSNNPDVASITNDGLVKGIAAGFATFTFTSTTGCSIISDTVFVGTFPIVTPTFAERKAVCENAEIQLSNETEGGVWTLSNENAEIVGLNTANPITLRGTATGQVYVAYTVGTGVCQSKATLLLKIIPQNQPKIILGMEK